MVAPLGASILHSGANSKHTTNMIEATKPVPRTRREIKLTTADEARFWDKVDKDGPTMPHMESACWVWTTGKNSHGYGHFHIGRGLFYAHRVSWILHNGQIPHDGSYHGICVCHRCDNPSCVNPSHLFLGTHTDNARDKEIKGRANKARGDMNGARLHPESVPRGELHGLAKLTASEVQEIRAIYQAGGFTKTTIGSMFHVTRVAISHIICRKTWKHI